MRLLLIMAIFPLIVFGQDEGNRKIKISFSKFKPCIFEQADDKMGGFEYELLQEIALINHWDLEFVEVSSFIDNFDNIDDGTCDLVAAGISVTAERSKKYDFSTPHLESGLRVLIKHEDNIWKESWYYLVYVITLPAVYCFILFVILFGHVIWWTEQGNDSFNDKYFPGIFEGMYFTLVTVTTVGYGDYAPKLWKGRTAVSILILFGIIFFGWFLSQVTAIPDYEPNIPSGERLAAFQVATKSKTTSHQYLKDMGVGSIKATNTIEEAYASLILGNSNAVVFDGPAVQYFKKYEGNSTVMYGPLFKKESYGFLMKQGSPLKEDLDYALLTLIENGRYDQLKKKWFGEM